MIPLTLTGSWQSFADTVLPANAPAIQITETSRAFHAGFCRAWEILTSHVADMDESTAMVFMKAMEAEILEYVQHLMEASGIDPAQMELIGADEGKPQ